jgi:hypothetical protein
MLYLAHIIVNEPSKEGCDLFLISGETTAFKTSDKNHLYLYKDHDLNQFFYFIGNPPEKHHLTESPAKTILDNANFNQTAEKPVKCENKEIVDVVLGITLGRGHTRKENNIEILKKIVEIYPELLQRKIKKVVLYQHFNNIIYIYPNIYKLNILTFNY